MQSLSQPEGKPLVSCIMPTYNRRAFIPHAIRYFLRQDYENKELIILDDGTDNIKDLVPDTPSIRYFHLQSKISLGAKLNLACQYARGQILANWDDDDWYAPRRLRYQVDSLQRDRLDVCGINRLFYYDLRSHHAHQYIYPSGQRTWLLGSSLCFTRERWEKGHFAEIDVGMDGMFVWSTVNHRIGVLPDPSFSVHMIHDQNISPKKTDGYWWHSYPVEEIQQIMGPDYAFYSNGTFADHENEVRLRDGGKRVDLDPPKPLRNIYACLVHEKPDCILDLVKNLHYHDPSSTILLYNGGQATGLLKTPFPFAEFNAVIHSSARPMRHGYLHHFALHCMEFAQEHFAFDTMTIVDSDQLCLRNGYPDYLTRYFNSWAGKKTGLLSSKPERVGPDDKTNLVAMQAFREYDLWKPLLKSFPEGENKFVHWTFWPSSVFTADACRDLTDLVNRNKTLQDILLRTKIWASEEVILPTLVSLLGYDISANPCSYDYVNYKKAYPLHELESALKKENVYWIHPVERKIDHPLRERIRKEFNDYAQPVKTVSEPAPSARDASLTNSIISRIQKIEGWLTDPEAELLLATALVAYQHSSIPRNLVEVGSYQGKSTLVLASAIQMLGGEAKIWAIDTHDGKQGAVDQGLKSFPPSLEMFQRNIGQAGLTEFVETITDKSYSENWERQICLLLIDGLHDYFNVARDFRHFSNCLIQGGQVAFHDYADYFPGVKAFVQELISKGEYRKINQAESLVVLQKL
jgi:glycosyltransferase involved in cell wall biosynthesis